MSTNKYEELRLKNLEDNRKILSEIGLINPYKKLPKVSFKKAIRGNKRKADDSIPSRPAKAQVVLEPENSGSLRGSRRRSARIQGKEVPSESELKDEINEWNDENAKPVKITPNRPNFYGAVPGVEIGTVWATRVECCRDGIHRPTVAGIHAGADGAYSIALSGGYEDNVDLGDCFTYTGEGGRDLKGTASNPKNLRTAPQSKDQTLTRGNLALSRNVETGNPVRVIRGYKLQDFSPFAPEDGYRYDGLYTVEKYWSTTGIAGFIVWKFALRRIADQPPPPWTFIETDGHSTTSDGTKSDSGFDSDETGSQISSSQSSMNSNEPQEKENSDNKEIKEESEDVEDEDGDGDAVRESDECKDNDTIVTDEKLDEETDNTKYEDMNKEVGNNAEDKKEEIDVKKEETSQENLQAATKENSNETNEVDK